MRAADQRWPAAAHAGTLVGICGSAIGLAGLCLVHDRFDLLLALAAPALALSLALGLLLIVAHRLAVCVCGSGRGTPHLVLAGGLSALLGILLLVADVWILPALRADPALRASLENTSTALFVPRALPLLAMVVGVCVLTVALVRLRTVRSPVERSPPGH